MLNFVNTSILTITYSHVTTDCLQIWISFFFFLTSSVFLVIQNLLKKNEIDVNSVAQRMEALSLYGSRCALSEDSGFKSYPSRREVYLVKNVVR